MAEIPENAVTEKDLEEWFLMGKELKKLRASEILLRKRIFNFYFPEPDEGVNKHELDGGYVLKGTYKLTRSVDIGAFDALKEKLEKEGVSVDRLVKFKPSLVAKEFNKLEGDKLNLFSQTLLIKPGSPTLEIVKPKRETAKPLDTEELVHQMDPANEI